jgi:quercetin dioxygenase-like cupin family protein
MTRIASRRTVFAAAALGLLAAGAAAQTVPLSFQASPEVYKVVAESATQRVIEVTWAPGQRDLPHAHPAAAVYFVTDCRLRFFLPDGTSRDGEPKAGQAAVQGPVVSHAVQNIGTSVCKLVMFEPK